MHIHMVIQHNHQPFPTCCFGSLTLSLCKHPGGTFIDARNSHRRKAAQITAGVAAIKSWIGFRMGYRYRNHRTNQMIPSGNFTVCY